MSLYAQSNFAPFQQQAYDTISTIYDQAMVSHQEHLRAVLNRISSTLLEPNSKILDIGSGTGKPVAEHFAKAGHDVTGIDFSSGMIELAQRQVPSASFIQAEMTSWEPSDSSSYDLIIVSNAFYILSVPQITSMIYKIAEWVKRDGLVVIGNCHNQVKLHKQGVQLDHRGWANGYLNIFLGQDTGDGIQGREEAWVNLIKEAGLDILDIQSAVCLRENDPDPDTQFYITARRTKDNHLLGPFPIPDAFSGPATIELGAWTELNERLIELDKVEQTVLEALRKEPSCRKVLYVDKSSRAFQFTNASGIEFQQASLLSFLDVQPGSVDGVLFSWILQLVPSPEDYLDHALKAISPTGNARLVVIQAAPDNELVNLMNASIQDLNLPVQHHGYLLKEAEAKFRAAGFQTIKYIRTQKSINFGSVEADERVATAANFLSRIWAVDKTVQTQIEERLKKLIKLRFIFKTSGRILTQSVILVAERN